eukprot:m.97735 g.97735  ORF g.97735 m.97735 type:complete len:434 (+) comp8833_c2_seq2:323-1624(+)
MRAVRLDSVVRAIAFFSISTLLLCVVLPDQCPVCRRVDEPRFAAHGHQTPSAPLPPAFPSARDNKPRALVRSSQDESQDGLQDFQSANQKRKQEPVPAPAGEEDPYSPFHLIWKAPKAEQEGGRRSGLTSTSITGCCDKIVKLCILSLLVHYPRARVLLWTNDFDQKQLTTLVDDPRVAVRNYDVHELSKDTPAASWFASHETGKFESVHFADMMRLLLLYRFGGSYVDVDSVAMESIPSLGARLGLPKENMTLLAARSDDNCASRFDNRNVASNSIYVKGTYKEAGASMRNCSFFLSNGLLFGFPPKFWFFEHAMTIFARDYRAKCWACHGPSLMARVFNEGLRKRLPVPHILPWRHMLLFAAERFLFNKVKPGSELAPLNDPRQRIFLHLELDKGDLFDNSTSGALLDFYEQELQARAQGKPISEFRLPFH